MSFNCLRFSLDWHSYSDKNNDIHIIFKLLNDFGFFLKENTYPQKLHSSWFWLKIMLRSLNTVVCIGGSKPLDC